MTVKSRSGPAARSATLARQIALVFHRLAVDGDDDVALLEAGLRGRAARHDIGDDGALGVLDAQREAISGVTLWILTPSQPRATWPCA